MMKKTDGVICVLSYSLFLRDDSEERGASVADVVRHINHIRKVAGVDHICIGGDFNGLPTNTTAEGWKDVAEYPNVFAELIDHTEDYEWTDDDLAKISNKNLLRVFRKVEEVRDIMKRGNYRPLTKWIPLRDFKEEDLQYRSEKMFVDKYQG